MTTSPPDLIALQHAISDATGVPRSDIGIIGNKAHIEEGVSYHLGKDQLKMFKNPYSARLARDKAGLTNFASAMDIDHAWTKGKGRASWLAFNALIVAALKGGDPALAAVRAVNYSTDGTLANRFRIDRQNGFVQEDTDDTVDIHTHIEWYRDTEGKREASTTRIVELCQQAVTGEDRRSFLMALTDTQQNAIAFTLLQVPNPDGTATRVALHVWCAIQDKTLDAIAAKAGMSQAELTAVKSAAAAGAHDGVVSSTEAIVSAVLAGLAGKPALTEADVETAVRAALAHPA